MTAATEADACPCDDRRRVGSHRGHFRQDALVLDSKTGIDLRASRSIEVHRCATCGPARTRIGVDMKNFDTALTAAIPIVAAP